MSEVKVKLLTSGGYKGLDAAVGHTFMALKVLGHWNIKGADLKEAGAEPCMDDYAFLQREIEVIPWHSPGL